MLFSRAAPVWNRNDIFAIYTWGPQETVYCWNTNPMPLCNLWPYYNASHLIIKCLLTILNLHESQKLISAKLWLLTAYKASSSFRCVVAIFLQLYKKKAKLWSRGKACTGHFLPVECVTHDALITQDLLISPFCFSPYWIRIKNLCWLYFWSLQKATLSCYSIAHAVWDSHVVGLWMLLDPPQSVSLFVLSVFVFSFVSLCVPWLLILFFLSPVSSYILYLVQVPQYLFVYQGRGAIEMPLNQHLYLGKIKASTETQMKENVFDYSSQSNHTLSM